MNCKGKYGIKEIINITNESYPKNEEDCFFLLEINIQALDDLNIKPEIKNNICFIDFPGHNTNDNFFFDKNIYQKVLKMCSFFIYINGGKAFKEDANKLLLSKMFSEVISSRKGDISPKEFLNLCLFIFNKVDSLEQKERNFNDVKEDIKEILRLPNNFESNISCSFFSALIFKKFLEKKNEYKTENIIKYLLMKFKSQEEDTDDDDDIFFGNNQEKDLTEFIKINISKNIKFDFNQQNFKYNHQNNIFSSNIYKELKEIVEKYYKERNFIKSENYENNLISISELLISCQENLTKLNYYKESYAQETFENIYLKINKSFDLKKKEYDNHLDRFFYFMNKFFRLENVFENDKYKSDSEKNAVDWINEIEKIFKDFKGKEMINKQIFQISDYISAMERNFNTLMLQNGYNVKSVIDLVEREILAKYEIMNNMINEEIVILKITIIEKLEKAGIDQERIKIDYDYTDIKVGKEESGGEKLDNIFSNLFLSFFPIFELFTEKNINENAFHKFIQKKLKENEEKMHEYNNFIDEKVEELRLLCINNADRLFGLKESNNIEIDDFWKETKDIYIELFNQYIDIEK